MNKTELIAKIVSSLELEKKEAEEVKEGLIEQMTEDLSGVSIVHQNRYDFINSNRKRNKKGKRKKNWE